VRFGVRPRRILCRHVTALRGSPWRPRMTLMPRERRDKFRRTDKADFLSARLDCADCAWKWADAAASVVFMTANAIGSSVAILRRPCPSRRNHSAVPKTCNWVVRRCSRAYGVSYRRVSPVRWFPWRHGNASDWWLIPPPPIRHFVGRLSTELAPHCRSEQPGINHSLNLSVGEDLSSVIWNNLPTGVRSAETIPTFRTRLKSQLFSAAVSQIC